MVQFLKLVNGEEIVADVNENDGEWAEKIVLHRPCRHIMTNQGPIISPYPSEEVTIGVHHVLFQGIAVTDLANAYYGITGGVITSNRKIQLPN